MKTIKTSLNLLIILLFLNSCHSGYEKRDGKVYHKWIHGGNWTREYSLVKEADASTFKTIKHNLNIDLGKDKKHVFKDASLLEYADPKTFEQVKEYYWKDKNFVYLIQFGGSDCRIIQSDPATFIVIKDFLWAKDKRNVYYEFKKLDNVKPNDFEAITENWGKDKTHYFYHNLRLDSLDYKSAEIVYSYFDGEPGRPSEYIKDKNQVFFHNRLVKDANPRTFVADGVGTFGHDDRYMFNWENNEGQISEQYRKTYLDKK